MDIVFLSGLPCTQKGKVIVWTEAVLQEFNKSTLWIKWGRFVDAVVSEWRQAAVTDLVWGDYVSFFNEVESQGAPLEIADRLAMHVNRCSEDVDIVFVDGAKSVEHYPAYL